MSGFGWSKWVRRWLGWRSARRREKKRRFGRRVWLFVEQMEDRLAPSGSSLTALSSSVDPSVFGQTVVLTASVTAVGPPPTGAVTFNDGATSLGIVAPSAGQLVNNGGFEAGFSGWTFSANAAGNVSLTNNVHSGSYAAYLAGSSSDVVYLSQSIATVAGTPYTFGWWLSTSQDYVDDNQFLASWGGTTIFNQYTVNLGGQYVQYSFTVTASSSTTTIQLGYYPAGRYFDLDDVSVTPQTSTAALATSILSVCTHSLTAVYGGDTNFSGGTSASLLQTVTQAGTSTTVTSSVNPSAFGQSVTFTATVTASPSTLTGTMTFQDGTLSIGTAVLSSGTATLTTSSLTIGTHTITATYSGDTNFASSTSTALLQTVNQAATSTTVTSSSNPAVFGQMVTYTATVNAVSPGTGTPTGTATFFDGGNSLGTGVLNSSGVATFTTSFVSVGNHSTSVVYGGDGNFVGGISASITQTVDEAGTTTTITSAPNPSAFGQSVLFTAAVSASGGTPTGTVTFKDAGSTLGTSVLPAPGSPHWSIIPSMPTGRYSLAAATGPDGRIYAIGGFNSSIGYLSTVEAYSPITDTWSTVASLPAPRAWLAATTGPDGRIYAIGGYDSSLSATSSVYVYTPSTNSWTTAASMPAARVALAAVTGSDGRIYAIGGFVDSSFDATNSVFAYTPSTNTWTAVASMPSARGFLAAATSADGRIYAIGGFAFTHYTNAVEVYTPGDDTWTIASGMPTPRAVSVATRGPDGRIYVVGGYDALLGTTNSVYAFAPSSNTWTNSSNLLIATDDHAGTVGADGSIYAIGGDGGQNTVEVLSFSSAVTLNTSNLAAGTHTIVAVYAGDSNCLGSSSSPVVETVNTTNTITTVTSSKNPSIPNQSVTFTVTVTVVNPGAGTPTGTVIFQNGNAFSSLQLSGGSATFLSSALAIGTYAIAAVYDGDSNFAGSTSNILTQNVSPPTTTTTLFASSNPSLATQSITFTAVVQSSDASTGMPTGTVVFLDGGASIAAVVVTNGQATFSTSAFAAGSHPITAVYGGTTVISGSTSATYLQTVKQVGVLTTLSSSPNPAGVGQPVTFTATVGASGLVVPTGVVTFFDNGNTLATGNLDATGKTTFSTSSLGTGSHSIVGVYSGDTNYSKSTSVELGQLIVPAATLSIPTTFTALPGGMVTVPVNLSASNYLEEAYLAISYDTSRLQVLSSADIQRGTLTNEPGRDASGVAWRFDLLRFNLDNSAGTILVDTARGAGAIFGFGSGSLVQITFHVVSGAPAGNTVINLRQSIMGANTFLSAYDAKVNRLGNFKLSPAPTDATTDSVDGIVSIGQFATTTLTASPSSIYPTHNVTITATVSGSGGGTPTGTVTFFDGSTSVGTAPLSSGTATFSTTSLAVGTHSLSAVYGGDTVFLPSTSAAFTETVNPLSTLYVTNFVPTTTGFQAIFSNLLNTSQLNLYDDAADDLGPPDVTLIGSASGPLHGSLVVDQINGDSRITFIQTGQTGLGVTPPPTGILANDTYTVTLRSATNGFVDTNGNLLDGNADDMPGQNFVTTFVVANPQATPVVSIPDFMRGPGQVVDVPNAPVDHVAGTENGIPLRLLNTDPVNPLSVTSLTMTLAYNPAMLTITGSELGDIVPAGASVSVDTSTAGLALITFTSPNQPFVVDPSAGYIFASLLATVPTSASYGSKEILDLQNIQINGAITALGDDAIHVVGYLGDTDANFIYTGMDSCNVDRVAVGMQTGFEAWPLVDPVIIADINSSGDLTGVDSLLLARQAVGMSQSVIPPLPAVTPIISGPDPLLNIPTTFSAKPQAVVWVPVNLDDSEGLDSVELAISYDTSRLEVFSAADVQRGSLLQDFDSFTVSLDKSAGVVRISAYRSAGPLQNDSEQGGVSPPSGGSIALIGFNINQNAPPGPAIINLLQNAGSMQTLLGGTDSQGQDFFFDLEPRPSNVAGDVLDGQIIIQGNANTTQPPANRQSSPVPINGVNYAAAILEAMKASAQVGAVVATPQDATETNRPTTGNAGFEDLTSLPAIVSETTNLGYDIPDSSSAVTDSLLAETGPVVSRLNPLDESL